MVVNFARVSATCESLKQVFQNIDAQSCPQSFNFHMHTVYSDGKLQPSVLVEEAMAIGLKGFAITDHHSINGYKAAYTYLNCQNRDVPLLWTGVEVNANLLDVEVHILGYAFELEHPRMQPYIQRVITNGEDYQAQNVIAAIHAAGGLAVLAHPARYKRSLFDLIPAAAAIGIDGVEAFYAYNNPNPWKPSPRETPQVEHLAAEYGLLTTCGTDTHGLSLLQRI
jgi:predicted metal-dependent phosphoesterase TrpH